MKINFGQFEYFKSTLNWALRFQDFGLFLLVFPWRKKRMNWSHDPLWCWIELKKLIQVQCHIDHVAHLEMLKATCHWVIEIQQFLQSFCHRSRRQRRMKLLKLFRCDLQILGMNYVTLWMQLALGQSGSRKFLDRFGKCWPETRGFFFNWHP